MGTEHEPIDHAPRGALQRLIGFVLEQRLVVIALLVLLVGWGAVVAPFGWDFGVDVDPVPVDAIPDIGENQQIVFTPYPGHSPQDVDDQVTYPLTIALMGIPGVRTIRSTSMFGFSTVYIIFEEGAEFYWTRARVVERLASLPANTLPDGVSPQLGPDATGLGQIYWYTLEGRDPEGNTTGGWDLHELRSIQDFQVRYALSSADGVAEVASVGGFVQEYQVDVDPDRMRGYGVTLQQVFQAVRDSNAEVGARTTEINGAEYLIRGIGFVRGVEDLEQTVVATVDNVPVRVSDVAWVSTGPAERRGALTRGGAEAVGGVVVARYGANPMEVIENVRVAIAEVAPSLPTRSLDDGTESQVTIVPFYDRTELIEATLGTLESALYQQILITVLVVLLLMFHIRSSALIAGLLPAAVLMTFAAMKVFGVDANVVALAGIAIAIGTMVDMGIVITENIVQRLRERDPETPPLVAVRNGAAEVAGAVLVASATTILSFIPVFFLEGPEGKLFGPLAATKTFAIGAAVLIAVFVLPIVAHALLGKRWPTLSIPERVRKGFAVVLSLAIAVVFAQMLAADWMPLGAQAGDARNVVFVLLLVGGLLGGFWLFQIAYRHLLRWVLEHKLVFIILPVAIVAAGLSVWLGFGTVFGWLPESVRTSDTGVWLAHEVPGLGSEFMPQLDEGDFLYMPSTMPHASIGEALEIMQQLDLAIESVPEVEYAVGKLGRAETALDPAPVSMIETIIGYTPEYIVDHDGRRVRFATDDDGEFLRDEEGDLIEDEGGVPFRNWREHIQTQQDIWDEIVAASQIPGLTSAPLLQPISARVVMLQSGIRAPMAVRLRGPNLEALAEASLAIEQILREHPMVNPPSVSADRPVGKPYLEIQPDRDALARYGITMRAFQDVVEIAIGGRVVGYTVEGRERCPIRVRYPRELRDTPDRIDDILLTASNGTQIPLGDVASIEYVRGPQSIRSENGYLVTYVMFDGLDEFSDVDVVESVRELLDELVADEELELPELVSYSFAGSYENALRAQQRLKVLIPIVFLSIFLLLHLQFRSVWTSLFVFSGVIVALCGGFVLIWFWGQPWFLDMTVFGANLRDVFQVGPIHLTVAVWVGFIALFGIATDDGVVMATYLKQQFEGDHPPTTVAEIRERVIVAGCRRIRPCLMTTATTILALLPILTSYGTGADVMIPMALPAVGGMCIALITLFIVPLLYSLKEEIGLHARRML